jgi:hypothetical protein
LNISVEETEALKEHLTNINFLQLSLR